MKKIILLLIFNLCFVCLKANDSVQSIGYYRNHYIVVVDQGKVQSHSNLPLLYNDIKHVFIKGSLPKGIDSQSQLGDFDFNPQLDQLSIYASYVSYNDFLKIKYSKRYYKPDSLNFVLVDNFIHPESDFQSKKHLENCDVVSYLDKHLYPLMSNGNVYDGIRTQVGLNEYIYPMILKKIDTSIPAQNYYVIVVSNFTSQGKTENIHDGQLTDFLGSNTEYIKKFDEFCNLLKSQFSVYENLKIIRPAKKSDSKNNPIALGRKLDPIVLSNSHISVHQAPRFEQKSYKSEDYEMKNSIILFKQDSSVKVNKVYLGIHAGFLPYETTIDITDDIAFDNNVQTYTVPSRNIRFGDDVNVGDSLKVKYIFFVDVLDKSGNVFLPMVLETSCIFCFDESDFAPIPVVDPDNSKFYVLMVIILLVIVLIVYGLYKLYCLRGLRQQAKFVWRIWPITNTRFMEVKNNAVINYDCWYWKGGDDNERQIQISGELSVGKRFFARRYDYQVEYMLIDADTNYDFTFRPFGSDSHGDDLKLQTFYGMSKNANLFTSSVIAYIDKKHLEESGRSKPDFSINNILSLEVKTKIVVVHKDRVIREFDSESKKYDFIVKPNIENTALWVAFDPGTTGSCVAFGQSAGIATLDNIYMAENTEESIDNHIRSSCIFPSRIKIEDESCLFLGKDVSCVKESEDFIFGNKANMVWGKNSFQSIKKLLGYRKPIKLKNKSGIEVSLCGEDLAKILVKGLNNHFISYLKTNTSVDQSIREAFCPKGHFTPQRAIVAVPNNFTMNKVQAMVNSLKSLNMYKEVHFIYESEAAFMTFLHLEYSNLLSKYSSQNKLFVVYDMGGATINITLFKLSMIVRNGYISHLIVDTVSKIGYTVGGDDIDYAIIQMIFNIPSVNKLFNVEEIAKEQKKHKNSLIELAQKIKLDWIETSEKISKTGNVTTSMEAFWGHLQTEIKRIFNIDLENITDDDSNFIKKESEKLTYVDKYVFANVVDAVDEVTNSIKNCNLFDAELILSGRTVLFPGIIQRVEDGLKEKFKSVNKWNGFINGKILDEEKLKTAVARGACWYAMNSGQISLNHNIVTSSFGYLDNIENKMQFVPVINSGEVFDNGSLRSSVQPRYKHLNAVRFVQMLGNKYETIYNGKVLIKHKMNILDDVTPADIDGEIKNVEIIVDDKGNFNYEITVFGQEPITKKTNKHSRLTNSSVRTEISDENSDAYVFATLVSNDETYRDSIVNKNITRKSHY